MWLFSFLRDNWVVISGTLAAAGVVAAIPQSLKAIPLVEFIATVNSEQIEATRAPLLSLTVTLHCRSGSARIRDDSRQCSQDLQEFWFPGTATAPALKISNNMKDNINHQISAYRDAQGRPLHVLSFLTPLRGGDSVVIGVPQINGKVDDGDFKVKNKRQLDLLPQGFSCEKIPAPAPTPPLQVVSQWTCTETVTWSDKLTSLIRLH